MAFTDQHFTQGLSSDVLVQASELEALRHRVATLEAEAAARSESEAKLRLILDQMPFVVWTVDLDLRFTSSSGRGLQALNLRPDEIVGASLYDYFGTSDPKYYPIACHLRALSGESFRYENEWGGRHYLVSICPLNNVAGEISGALGAALDLTDRKRAEQQAAAMLETAGDCVFTHDLDGNLLSINAAGERLLGYTRAEICQLRFWDLIPVDERPAAYRLFQDLLSGNAPPVYELGLLTRAGQRVSVEISTRMLSESGSPSGVLGFARDITQRKQLEEQLRQSQKMEAIGTLAGGIAHDFNNLLTGIIGYGYLLKQDIETEAEPNEALSAILHSAERAAELTAQLLGFARRGKNQNAPVDVHATLDDVISLLERTIDKKIGIERHFNAPEALVKGDPTQIRQMFLNLALNAREAMPQGGTLRIGTQISQDGELLVSVSDTGSGISPEIRDKIFEPFFTTKQSDKVSGMGLAMVYGIVKNHGGSIRCESEAGVGTVMEVSLPRCAELLDTPQVPVQLSGRHGSILVVDDEDVVRQVLSRMLQQLGYSVTTAADGSEALELYRKQPTAFDLVILDMVMPRMNGRECFAAIRAVNPKVRAILSTGYGQDGAAQEIIDEGIVGFLQKPYHVSQLAQVVQRAIGVPQVSA